MTFSEFLTFCILKNIVTDTGSTSQSGTKGVMHRIKIAEGDHYAIVVHQGNEVITSCLYKRKDDGTWDEWPQPDIKHLASIFCK